MLEIKLPDGKVIQFKNSINGLNLAKKISKSLAKEAYVASEIGGSKETIVKNKSGLLFKSGDPISLAEKLKEILSLDENATKLMGIEGRKNVLKKFDVEKMCNSTITEYKKLIG